LDAVQEKDFVRGGYEQDAGSLLDGHTCDGMMGSYEALGLGSATVFFGLEPEDIYCFSNSGRGAMPRMCPLQDKADQGSFLKEYWELSLGLMKICIGWESLMMLPRVHFLKAVQLSRLRCIERH
jgi:hypothetical protein